MRLGRVVIHLIKTLLMTSLCMLMITSCAITPSKQIQHTKKLSWDERKQQLNRLQTWQLNGKIAVQTAAQAGSATLNWSENKGRYFITLAGPLGSHAIQLKGGSGAVTLINEKGQHLNARSAEVLLAKQWGYHLPVSNMIYWIRGLPAPGLPHQEHLDQQARLMTLTQMGWFIQFQQYTTVNNIDLPEKMTISSQKLKSKIIIYSWQLA